jgi:hypothetical protein
MRKYDKYKKYYINTSLILKRKNSNKELVLNMFKEGKCEFAIHKETKIGRSVIKRILLNIYFNEKC